MRINTLSLLLVLAAMTLPASVWAASDTPARLIPVAMAQKLPVPEAQILVVPVAQLMRVDEGVFELEVRKTIDLTDRKILLGVEKCDKDDQVCVFSLNGDKSSWRKIGHRFDLRRWGSTASFVKDKDVCFVDVVDIAVPKGARAIVTFRLHCL